MAWLSVSTYTALAQMHHYRHDWLSLTWFRGFLLLKKSKKTGRWRCIHEKTWLRLSGLATVSLLTIRPLALTIPGAVSLIRASQSLSVPTACLPKLLYLLFKLEVCFRFSCFFFWLPSDNVTEFLAGVSRVCRAFKRPEFDLSLTASVADTCTINELLLHYV